MKILFVDHSSSLGGGQLGLLRYLRYQSPHERSLVVLEDGPLAHQARALSIPVTVLTGGHSRLGSIRVGHEVRKAVRLANPDVVITNSMRSANLMGIFRTRHTHIAYLREDLSPASISGKLKRPLMIHFTLKRFNAFLANSEFTAQTIPDSLTGKPVEVAYPVSGIHSTTVRKTSISASRLVVLSLSRLAEWKGIHVLLGAARLLTARGLADRFDFQIAGDSLFENPEYKNVLSSLADSSGASVTFLGHVEDTAPLLTRAHVLAHCSLRPEPYGQVIPQGMINGLVTVATDGGGPAEMIEDGVDGFLLPAGDPTALADRLEALAGSQLLLETIRAKGVESAARFLDSETAPAFDRAVESLCRRKTNHG